MDNKELLSKVRRLEQENEMLIDKVAKQMLEIIDLEDTISNLQVDLLGEG